jgi:tetratricopeptide (TPR) repeat protein
MLVAAVEYYSEGKYEECERLLRGLLVLEPEDPRPLKLLGSTLLLQDRRREAEIVYRRALDMDPEDPYALVAAAEIALDALRIDDALPLFERLFALDPDGAHPAANRGRKLLADAEKMLSSEGEGE